MVTSFTTDSNPLAPKASLAEALGALEITDLRKLWPTVAALVTWAEPYDALLPAQDGTSTVEMLARMQREDLMAWAIESQQTTTPVTQQDLNRALTAAFEESFEPGVRVLWPLLHLATLRQIDQHGRSAFHRAPATMLAGLTGALIDAGVDVNHANQAGVTPLMALVETAPPLEAVQRLLDAGAAVNAVDLQGNNAFNLAAYHGDVALMDHLIAAGAEVHNVNKNGRNALMQALSNPEVVPSGKLDRLLPLIDPHACDQEGITALDEALESSLWIEAERLASAMRPDVVKHVLRPHLGQSANIDAWFQAANEREAQTLRDVLQAEAPAQDPVERPRRRM